MNWAHRILAVTTEDRLQMSPQQRRYVAVLVATLAVLGLLLVWVLIKSTLLRPGGDDYCIGVASQFGILGGPIYWWNNFSGYLTPSFGANTLVGLPLLHLPLAVASAIPFITAAALVTLATVVNLRGAYADLSRWMKALLVGAVPTVMVSWWAYWWLPMTLGQQGNSRFLAQGLTHNQILNGGHVFQTALVVVLLSLAWRSIIAGGRSWWALIPAAGVSAAFSGPAMALGLLLMALAIVVASWISGSTRVKVVMAAVGLLTVCTVIASVVAQAAPGTQARSQQLGLHVSLGFTQLGEMVNAVLPSSVFAWAEAFLSPGTVVVVLLTTFVSWLFVRSGFKVDVPWVAGAALALTCFSLTLSIASRFTEIFAYDAFWHFTDTRVAAFIAIVLAGVALGQVIARFAGVAWDSTVLLAGSVGLMLAVGSILSMTISIADRAAVWERGPAPIEGVVTEILDDERGFCWGFLAAIRELPDRGVARRVDPYSLERDGPLMSNSGARG